ncbi:MAG: acetoin utilization protein AcuC [Actinomycetota bacterium]|nr:acetoin utilization protein AcuC [Actinomycetota bacterium]
MSDAVRVLWDDSFVGYDLGPDHPMQPVRLELTIALARELGVLGAPGVSVASAEPASDGLLTLVHDPRYLAAVRRAPGAGADQESVRFGLGTDDNPIFPRMHEASALVVGASVEAARAVHSGEVQHAVSIAGGLHHAMAASAAGFCVYNDVAVAIAWLLEQGVQRVAYVDVDVHHGDGVQAAYYADPRVLTISLHESGETLWPGTGFPEETGSGDADGMSVNVALPAGTTDLGWLRAFHAVVPPLLKAFAPQVLVTQHGCDSHRTDPLANLALTVDGQRASYAALHALAHRVCGGRWVALGGGGYQLSRVVPRAWAHLLAEAAGVPLPPATQTPQRWRDLVADRVGTRAPETMTDGGETDYVPWDAGDGDAGELIDKAVAATRRAVFPLHGLDPLYPQG